MNPDAPTRIRQRIARLLDDRGHTQRAFARALGHGDQWASNFLSGRNHLAWDDLDKVADFLKVPPSELVRASDEPWELSPTEMRVVRVLRMLPPPVRDMYATLAEYTVGTLPDEFDLIVLIRMLDDEAKTVLRHWAELKRVEQAHARTAPSRVDLREPSLPPAAPTRHTQKRRQA